MALTHSANLYWVTTLYQIRAKYGSGRGQQYNGEKDIINVCYHETAGRWR